MSTVDNEFILSIKLATTIWSKIQSSKKDPEWNKKTIQEKMQHFESHPTFGKFTIKHSIPLRYMIQYGEFNLDAFKKYLNALEKVGYHSKDDWVKRQADYVKFLWQAYNPHRNLKEANIEWQIAYQSIKAEMDSFESDYERAKKETENRIAEASREKKELLKQLLQQKEKQAELAKLIVEKNKKL